MSDRAAAFSLELPLIPIGAPNHEQGLTTYLDYWQRQLEADPDLLGAIDLSASARKGSRILRNPESNPSTVSVQGWYNRLGPGNHMEQGLGDLLIAATCILQANQRGPVPATVVRNQTDNEDIADAFLDFTDHLDDMERQRPSKQLVTVGEMVCRAALGSDDIDRKDDLLDIAGRIFQRIHAVDTFPTAHTIKAGQFLSDIKFHQLSQRIRQSRRAHADTMPYRTEAGQLLDEQIRDLVIMPEIEDFTTEQRGLGGKLFELFSSIVVRHAIYFDSDIKGNHPEIRTALTVEDNPIEPTERKVDSKFDLVLQRVTSNDRIIAAEPWQLKMGHGACVRIRPYHPSIVVISGQNLAVASMVSAAKDLQDMYRNRQYDAPPIQPVEDIQKLFTPYVASSKAA